MRLQTILLGCGLAVGLAFSQSVGALASRDSSGVVAEFEGGSIRLTDGWGDATACVTDKVSTRCYRTEDELIEREGLVEPKGLAAQSSASLLSSCSSYLQLYNGTGYSSNALYLSTRFTLFNLSAYNFNNVTSSYKVGACSATFYDSTTGSGVYPGTTSANTWASSMLSGWNNRVGSVYIS